MFQYAAGRALALRVGTALKMDTSGFKHYGLHQGFELNRLFNLSAQVASSADMTFVLGWQSSSIVRRLISLRSLRFLRAKNNVVEPHFNYWQGIEDVVDDKYLFGYWQSEKYFRDAVAEIRKDFTFASTLTGENLKLGSRIAEVNGVSLHIRRGDYVSNAKTAAAHPVCSLEYYRAGIEHIAANVKNPTFFIFSDDIVWAKSNLQMDFPHQYVDQNHGRDSYNDMRLMSMCKHHIIANSSFSWWGAWLNIDSKKIVIAPKKWFSAEVDTSDLYPDGWITL